MLDALGLVTGDRANLSLIKNKEKSAVISAEFNMLLLNQDIKQNLAENYGIYSHDLYFKASNEF
ncbi:MAG: hypothetical protein MTP17_02835 [Candidatus Midichloria sp.]|nr:MAG: hypothetical protein MTP17_02835 [Candidatus Midichloria sp.]